MKKLLYQISTHWDREWYRQFQGFRYYLVEMVDKLLDTLEKGGIPEFVFDGQTIVLEDYLEVRPENRARLEALIRAGKLKIGPWYVMPDELIVSGEGLIENLLVGQNDSREFGVKTWKCGYVCDIFGHIASLPQIFNGFGIGCAYLGRGISRLPNGSVFLWRSPDGSECVVCKDNYANFKRGFDASPDKAKFLADRLGDNEIAVVNYSDDHAVISDRTLEFSRAVGECDRTLGGLCELSEISHDGLQVISGELIETAHSPSDFRAVTGSISSYYPLKRQNDLTEKLLWHETAPLIVMGELCGILENKRKFFDIARKYLLKNHPHDSICGCSIDAVHEDMPYRFSQAQAIGNVINEEFRTKLARTVTPDGSFTITVVNTRLHMLSGVFTLRIDFPLKWGSVYTDNVGYQNYNTFTVLDSSGRELPYQILKIERGVETYERQDVIRVNRYTIALEASLLPFGFTQFRIEPKDKRRAIPPRSPESNRAENEYLSLVIEPDGSLTITDKATGKSYRQLYKFIDDGDAGNGWFYEPAAFDEPRVISSAAERIEVIHSGELVNTFRVTTRMEIPHRLDSERKIRSEDYLPLEITSEITLRKGQRFVEFAAAIDNRSSEHRLRVVFPSGVPGENYFASQAFGFVERERGSSAEGYAGRETEYCEKNTSGIVGVDGVAFVGAEGFHEGGVYPDGTISMTMLRSVGKMFHQPDAEYSKLIGKLEYRFALAFGCERTELLEIQRGFDPLITAAAAIPERSFMSVHDRRIFDSIVKPAENGRGYIVRLLNPTGETIDSGFESELNVAEARLDETLKDKTSLELAPYEIKTLMLE